jgi:hypothetical protein
MHPRPVSRRCICSLLVFVAFVLPLGASRPAVAASSLSTTTSLSWGWSHTLLPVAADPAHLAESYGITQGGPGLIAYSLEGLAGGSGWLLSSPDGHSWTPLPRPAVAQGDLPSVFFAVGRLFIIAGFSTAGVSVPRLWVSQDGGLSGPECFWLWHKVDAPMRTSECQE